jgi:hypothetical protein
MVRRFERLTENSSGKNFDELLFEAIDDALLSLGTPARAAIYFHLEKDFGIEKGKIYYRLEDFADVLEKIFGSGIQHLEVLLMKNLQARVRVDFETALSECVVPELTFTRLVHLMRQVFEREAELKSK